MHQPGVYAIHNKRNGKYYIGSTNDLHNRTKTHRQNLYNGLVNDRIRPDLFSGARQNDFEFIALEIFQNGEITEAYLRSRENYYIEKYKSDLEGYNNPSHRPVAHPKNGHLLVYGHPKKTKEKYDKILLRLPKGMKEEIQMCTTGSVNNFIFEAIREKIDKEGLEELPAFMRE